MSELGIDVFEKYQGAIDWPTVARSGVKHALIKLTNGAAVASPAGDHYVGGAHGAGLRVGGYAYALGGDPVAEANIFANELLRLGALDDAPALDYEDASVPQGTTAQGWIAAFFVQLKARIPQLTRVLLYSSGSMLTRVGAAAVQVPGLTIMIWDAEYGANDGTEHPMHYYTGPVAIHQYTSAGHVPGISGAVDEDDVTTDITAEADMPLTDADAQLVSKHGWYDPIWSGKNPDGTTWYLNASQVLDKLDREIQAATAKIDALATAVANLATNPDVTPAQVQQWLNQAVAEHLQITGTVQIGPAPTGSTS